MGIYSNAHLIYGIPVLAQDEEGEPTSLWNPTAYGDEGDWRDVPEPLKISTYGHFEDYEHRAILTSTKLKSFSADCWDIKSIGKWDFNVEDYQPADVDEFTAAVAELDEGLLDGTLGWYLVASVG